MASNTKEETGRYIIFFHPPAISETAAMLNRSSGIAMTASAGEAEFLISSEDWRDSDTLVIPSLGVAVVSASPEQISRIESGGQNPIRSIRKEYIFNIAGMNSLSDDINISRDYLSGYRDGINACIANMLNRTEKSFEMDVLDETDFFDDNLFTWGLKATKTYQSRFSGKGVRVAILDTGYDMNHPDFLSRSIVSKSFIENVPTAQDDNGHGTHCLGTLAGPKITVSGQRRYGIAYETDLFVGKVMNSEGKGNERDILHGIGWALQNQCRLISLSIGKTVNIGVPPDKDYEEIGAIALKQNCLLIAAAGNDSNRINDKVAPVNLPANSKTIFAVGAIDRRSQLYNKSNGGINPDGGGIDLVGPGVDVFSSKRTVLPFPFGFDTGTSMATPHVAGIAALMMESDPIATAGEIWTRLTQSAKRLPLSNTDVGSGLVQAP